MEDSDSDGIWEDDEGVDDGIEKGQEEYRSKNSLENNEPIDDGVVEIGDAGEYEVSSCASVGLGCPLSIISIENLTFLMDPVHEVSRIIRDLDVDSYRFFEYNDGESGQLLVVIRIDPIDSFVSCSARPDVIYIFTKSNKTRVVKVPIKIKPDTVIASDFQNILYIRVEKRKGRKG